MTRHLTATIIILTATIVGCGRGKEAGQPGSTAVEGSAPLVIHTVNYPLAYFAERIGGDLVDVRFPAPADEDPAFWSPDAETVATFQNADLILINGAGYARWVERATLPTAKLVDTSAGFAVRYIELEGAITHSHGPAGAHEHGGWAFTTWLDPTLAAEHARAVTEALVAARPGHEAAFRDAFTILESALLTLDARLAAATEGVGDAPLVFSHPVFQYLERRYQLNGRSVHWEPDQAPDLDELKHLLADHPAKWMVWEGEPPADTVHALEAIGLGSVVFDPSANQPETGDYLSIMESNAEELETIAGL
jgi:zinc transport system substrate-binding protein